MNKTNEAVRSVRKMLKTDSKKAIFGIKQHQKPPSK